MKKLFLLSALFVFSVACAQNVKNLNEDYYLDLTKLQEGIPVVEIKDASFEETTIYLKEGQYSLQNATQKLLFTVNKNGELTGSATGGFIDVEGMDLSYWTFLFEKGKVKELNIKLALTSHPITKINANDTVFTLEHFDDKRHHLKRRVVMKNGEGPNKAIELEYFDNGNTKYEFNNRDKTSKEYYENGHLKYYFDKNTAEKISYDETGTKTQHYYHLAEGGWCEEYFEKGTIIKKDCHSADYSTQTLYYYKNGEVDFYEIINQNTGERNRFDKTIK